MIAHGGYESYTGKELAAIGNKPKTVSTVRIERAKAEYGVRCPDCGGKIKIEPCIYCETLK